MARRMARGQEGAMARAGRPRTVGLPSVPGKAVTFAGKVRPRVPPSRHRALAPSAFLGLVLALTLSACRVAGPPAGRARLTTEPQVRVGVLVDSPAVQLSATSPFQLTGPAGDVLAAGDAGALLQVTADAAGLLSGTVGAARFGPVQGPLGIRPADGGTLRLGGRGYRGGALLVSRRPGRVTAVNVVALEDYLRGVVALEIGHLARSEVEAAKAQAVAARTYAVDGLGKRRDFDFYATVQDQVYGGLAGEDPVAEQAVADTRGEIVTYQDQPILAYYHSTCGGTTAALDESWPWRAPQPYLREVSDRIPGGSGSYCGFSSRYRWSTAWTPSQLRTAVARAIAALTGGARRSVDAVEDVRILGRTPGGRVAALLVRADGRDYIVHGDSARYLLRTPAGAQLNSSLLFDLTLRDGALEVHGGGWGHGIGMCQAGAIGRARAGQRYREILRTYYPDTRVTRLY